MGLGIESRTSATATATAIGIERVNDTTFPIPTPQNTAVHQFKMAGGGHNSAQLARNRIDRIAMN
jgi:hypothetical protein